MHIISTLLLLEGKAVALVTTRSFLLRGNGIVGDDGIIHEVPATPSRVESEEDDVELFYPTTKRAFKFPNHEKVVNIRQTSFGCGKLGATLWPSSIALASLLAGDSKGLIEGKRVLELGSGCGLPSLVVKELCNAQKILATDYWEVEVVHGKPLLSLDNPSGDRLVPKNLFGANLAYNMMGSSTDDSATATVRRLDWHDVQDIFKIANEFSPDVIIGSDLVYYPMDTSPLLQTLEILLKNGGGGAKEVLLISPLPPKADREALPEFRRRLESGELGEEFEVEIDELEMDAYELSHNLLRIQIRHRS